MHHHVGGIETALEETLIRLDLERVRHVSIAVGQHAVGRYDGVGHDAHRGR